jgi:hypothetical protein
MTIKMILCCLGRSFVVRPGTVSACVRVWSGWERATRIGFVYHYHTLVVMMMRRRRRIAPISSGSVSVCIYSISLSIQASIFYLEWLRFD